MATAKKVLKKKVAAKPAAKKRVAAKPARKVVKSPARTAKTTAKKTVAKKVTRRTKAAAPEIKPIKTKFTQTQIIQRMAEKHEIAPKALKAAFGDIERLIAGSLKKGGVGSVAFLGFTFKSRYKAPVKVPAIKKGTMVKNPFNGGKEEPHKGRPASVRPAKMVLKALPRKPMKDAVAI